MLAVLLALLFGIPTCKSLDCEAPPEPLQLLQRKLHLGHQKPHILLIVSDDQGWGHLGLHRSEAKSAAEKQGQAEIFTPHLEALIREGIKLERHYAAANSAPARCSLQSGRLSVDCRESELFGDLAHLMLLWNQSNNVSGFFGMPRNMTGLGTKMKEAGYATHYIGKWDIGYATPEQTPWGRGYESFLGFLHAGNNYWSEFMNSQTAGKLDMKVDICLNKFLDFSLYNATYRAGVTADIYKELGCNMTWTRDTVFDANGCREDDAQVCLPDSCYQDAILGAYAKKIIQKHDVSKPMFMTFSLHTPHEPKSVPKSYMQKLDRLVAESGVRRTIPWTSTRKYKSAMLLYMDDAIGKLIDSVKERGMYENTLVIFISDNGAGVNLREAGSNYPLKGGKWSQWEGALRTVAAVSGGFLPPERRGGKFEGVIHIADWYSTLCNIAGVSHFDHVAHEANQKLRGTGLPELPPVAGRPQWQHILDDTNGRPDALHLSTSSLLQWPYKLLTGVQNFSFWPGPVWPNCSSERPKFPFADVLGRQISFFHGEARLENVIAQDCGTGCLYNVEEDPSEQSDLSTSPEYTTLLGSLQQQLKEFNLNTRSTPEYGATPSLNACWQGLETGTYGPWVDAEGFYTHWPFGRSSHPQRDAQDREEILELNLALQDHPDELREELARAIDVDDSVSCIE